MDRLASPSVCLAVVAASLMVLGSPLLDPEAPGQSTPVPPAEPTVAHPVPSGTVLPATLITKTEIKWNQLCASGAGAGSCPPNYQPPPTYRGASFWDNVNDWTIYFGGQFFTNASLGGTYAWNQTADQWMAFNTTAINSPSARANLTGVWDYKDNYGVIFGGYQNTVLPTVKKFLSDTWEWYPGTSMTPPTWINITTATHPSARGDYAMTYIPTIGATGGYALLFGGATQGNHLLSDTWEFSGGVWTNITSTAGSAPPATAAAGFSYDDVDHYAVLFGGVTGSGFSNGTYEFNPATSQWSTICANASTAAHCGPKAEAAVQMVNDTADHLVYLTGGTSSGAYPLLSATNGRTSWGFVGGQWSNLTFLVNKNDANAGTTAPSNLIYAPIVYEPPYALSVMQGGKGTSSATNGTYEVGALIAVNVALNVGEIVVRTPVTVWANATLVAPPVTYSWTVPTGCSNPGNVSTFTCSPSSTGFQRFTVVIVDINNATTSNGWSVWVDPASSIPGTLSINSTGGFALPSTFFATDIQYPVTGVQPALMQFINNTPIRWFRAPDLEGLNASDGEDFAPSCPSSAHSPGGYVGCLNLPSFTNWLAMIGGHSFVTLPALENNTALDVADAEWVVNVANYTPDYWVFGNEPEGWTVFNVSIGTASPPIGSVPSALNHKTAYKYGIVLAREASAVKAVFPSIPIINIQANGNCLDESFMGQAELYAHQYTKITSCHIYPSWPGYAIDSPTTYAYETTRNITFIATNWAVMNTYLAGLCSGCGQPIWITEMNTASGGSSGKTDPFYNYTIGWPSVSFLSANFIATARAGVPQWMFYVSECDPLGNNNLALLNTDCSPREPALTYEHIFDNFHFHGTIYNATFSGAMRGVYALEGTDATGTSLLISNTNTTETAVIALPPNFANDAPGTITVGNATTGWEVYVLGEGSVPHNWVVGPETVLMINIPAGGGGGYVPRAPGSIASPGFRFSLPGVPTFTGSQWVGVGAVLISIPFLWNRRYLGFLPLAIGVIVFLV